MGISAGSSVGKAGANSLGARDHAADAGGKIVGALVAEHLQRHARRDLAFERGIGGVLAPGLRQRGQKSAHRRAKAGAGDVDFHRLAVDFRQGFPGPELGTSTRTDWGTHVRAWIYVVLHAG